MHFKKVESVPLILEAILIKEYREEYTHVAFLRLVHEDVPPPKACIVLVNY
jgi:hypothetical protein